MNHLHKPFLVLLLLFGFTALTPAQNSSISNGKIPAVKQSHIPFIQIPTNTDLTQDMAYGSDQTNTLSLPLPAGTPITNIGTWYPPVFASSGVRGGDINYYFVDVGPPSQIYKFEPNTGSVTLVGAITGMESGATVNGITYDAVNSTYYLCGGVFGITNNLYSFNMSTLTATLVGSFPNPTGAMIDIAINWFSGIGYGYDLITDDAWTFDPVTGTTTLLGPLGFDANYGQGMDIDQATGTIYLSAFNNTTFTGQLRTMDPVTGATTLLADWGLLQIAPFAINTECCGPPCVATNPDPTNGATGVSNNVQISWNNCAGATSVQVFWGTSPGSMASVYNGLPITNWDPGTLDYYTTYYWRVDETDSAGTFFSSTWHFKTMQNPLFVTDSIKVYPQSAAMWTGNTEGTTKTDGEINTVFPNVGWAVFDISSFPTDPTFVIDSIKFYGYVNSTNWPYWSATPMGSVNPVNDDAVTINNQIQNNAAQGTAYIYSNETSTYPAGWHSYLLGNNALTDIQNALTSHQGWFSIGFIDRDTSTTYYINFDGWSQTNPPYLGIYYTVVTPVELTGFNAIFDDGKVVLNWQTATETNNKGFEVQKSNGSEFQTIGFVQGNGTSTEQHSYSYTDNNVAQGNYSYRLRQVDFDGSFKFSNEIKVEVNVPLQFSLRQNYPNPFNPTTQIKYSVPQSSQVQIKVFDILGNVIKILINEEKPTGTYELTWNAANLPSGIYFYRIQAGSFIDTKKMILLK